MRRKHELIDALQELRMQEEDVGCLEAECVAPTTGRTALPALLPRSANIQTGAKACTTSVSGGA